MPYKVWLEGEEVTAVDFNDYLQEQAVLLFSNAASRGAAITSPVEGMVAYLSTPGVLTQYDGSHWVQISPAVAAVDTQEVTASTTFVDLATPGPQVSLETSDHALVRVTSAMYPVSTANVNLVGVAISGATTRAAQDDGLLGFNTGGAGWLARATAELYMAGLTPGVNTFTLKYRVNAASTNFALRVISAVGVV